MARELSTTGSLAVDVGGKRSCLGVSSQLKPLGVIRRPPCIALIGRSSLSNVIALQDDGDVIVVENEEEKSEPVCSKLTVPMDGLPPARRKARSVDLRKELGLKSARQWRSSSAGGLVPPDESFLSFSNSPSPIPRESSPPPIKTAPTECRRMPFVLLPTLDQIIEWKKRKEAQSSEEEKASSTSVNRVEDTSRIRDAYSRRLLSTLERRQRVPIAAA